MIMCVCVHMRARAYVCIFVRACVCIKVLKPYYSIKIPSWDKGGELGQ